jgi:hypothetical protein
VLCNVETWAGELRDAVLETWRGLTVPGPA